MKFREEFAFLSNFHAAPVTIQGITYPTSEHAYVATKTKDLKLRKVIATLTTPGIAKRYGRTMDVRNDWMQIRVQAMEYIVDQKFRQNHDLKRKLVMTHDLELVEDNTWGDTFWGVCDGKGENHLGKILMQVRDK